MTDDALLQHVEDHFSEYTPDLFVMNMSSDLEEMELFYRMYQTTMRKGLYAWESLREGGPEPELDILRAGGERLHVVNLATYDYLGYSRHPEVVRAAQDALARYGLGTCSSPVIGRCRVHQQFEDALVRFYGLPTHRATVFNAGYAVNLGAIQAFIKPGGRVLLDSNVHMSIAEGAKLSGGAVDVFPHSDMDALEALLKKHCNEFTRVLICVDGLYSCDGDRAPLSTIVALAKRYGAFTLVDEAHSVLVAGATGRGVCEEQGVLEDVDMIVTTFSKGFACVGGAVIARREIAQYLNIFSNTRLFTCSLPPAAVAGMWKILELSQTAEGAARRERIKANADYFRGLLRGRVDLGVSDSWIVTVACGPDRSILEMHNFLQRNGLDASVLSFPAVPKDRGRLRMFVTSEHTREQLERAAEIIQRAARQFGFSLQHEHQP